MRKLVFILGFFCLVLPVAANDIYIAQSSSGAADGRDCADARPLASLAAGDWSPGNTIHLCGVFDAPAGANNYLVAQGSGTSGNPITIKFEPNAVIQAPYWGLVISLGGNSYLTVDGGTNGLIQATANGTLLANQVDSGIGVESMGGNNITVQNLTIANLYVHACTHPIANCTDEKGGNTNGILIRGGNNHLVANNTLHDLKWAVSISMNSQSQSNVTIRNNTSYNIDHGVFTTDGNNGNGAVMNGLYIYDNTWHDAANWDDVADNFHHDCTHNDLSHSGTSAINVFIYNNYCYGNWGVNMNSWVYLSSFYNSYVATVYNNVLIDGTTYGHAGCGMICVTAGAIPSIYNNTMIGFNTNIGIAMNFYGSGAIVYNNTIQSFYEAMGTGGSGTFGTIDYNNYYNIGTGGWSQVTFALWRQAAHDTHGSNTNPNLSASYLPTASSTALIQKGVNLTDLSITQLDLDKSGSKRPSPPTNWEIGAYQYNSGTVSTLPNPPTGLVASVQ